MARKDQGLSNDDAPVGTWLAGLLAGNKTQFGEALSLVEAGGESALTGEEVRWGLEHLNLDEKRIKKIGVSGLVQPLHASCLDHEGGGSAKVYQWDGAKLVQVSDWIMADKAVTRPLIEESAAKYAAEKGITPRDRSKEK